MTKINPDKLVAIANKLGLTVVKQPSQYKITGTDPNRRLYIPGTKTVHKVELSGWSHPLAVAWDSVFPGKKAPSPKITHLVNFEQEEKLVLRDFFKIAKSLAASSVPASPPAPEVASPPVAGEPAAQVA
jgi:hypothetical protein